MNHDALEEVILAVACEIAERQDFLKYLHAARDRKRATEHPVHGLVRNAQRRVADRELRQRKRRK